jgi:hypothetical protein
MTRTTKPKKWKWLRYRKNDLGHNVMVAVQRWIHANKGTAVVLGGIGVMDMGEFRYGVVVQATGRKPTHKKQE